jgi:hypothetical protein
MKIKIVLASVLVLLLRSASAQTELVVNGGFESNAVAPWQFVQVVPGAQVFNDPPKARSGSSYLSMGNNGNADQAVFQTVTIPTNAVLASLGFYWNVASGDASDTLYVMIVNANQVAVTNVATISGAEAGLGYQFAGFDMKPFIGQTVEIYFRLITGAFSTFRIDDVSLVYATAADFPVNDDFTNRIVLPATNSITVNANNTLATQEPGEPDHAGDAGGRSVWWSWTSPTNGAVIITTAGSLFDTVLAVYTGTVLSNLTTIAANDDDNSDPRNPLLTSRVKFAATAGVTYQIAVDGVGNASSQVVLNLNFQPDTKSPTVSITSPAANAKLTNSTVVVQGKAADDLGVALVQIRLENAGGTNEYQSAIGTNTWTATVTNLMPGLNTVRARAFDASSNVSATVTRSFNYVIVSPLTLTVSGNGTVTPNLNGQLLQVGANFTVTAKPGVGFIFAGWTIGVAADNPKLTFTMQSNLVLQANFIPNPFLPAVGTYQGLFYDTNTLAHQSAGLLTAKLSGSGGFSGKLLSAGKSYSLSGHFSATGFSSNLVSRSGLSPLTVLLQLDLVGADSMTGQVSDGTWIAGLAANRSTFNAMTNPAPQAGRYTFAIPPIADSLDDPGGAGFGSVTVTAAGAVQVSGVLGDGTKITQSAILSKDGQWAFYVPLYSGNGSDFGWQTFFSMPFPPGGEDFSGEAKWTKLPQPASKFYPGGFTNLSFLGGSRYSFTNGVPILNFTNGLVLLANGDDLAESFSNRIVFATNVVINLETNNLIVTITPASGLFKGTVVDPFTGRKLSFQGILVQHMFDAGEGFFLGTNRTGLFFLGPIPGRRGGVVGGF